ncbi:MAG: hypothetical protein Greene101420_673 [Parcubacteria group bacterium Greene1014_20]|nr:MAG: hypothetical protein Greene041636_669 [Parcubacteria group bacterium Greene0416_36]TSC98621.1 MAG: hypothetical protein Greene101420_673 [Parcubacteria group bacterium Greene1014_20]
MYRLSRHIYSFFLLSLLFIFASPSPGYAATITWNNDTTLQIAGPNINLIIRNGSQADLLTVLNTTFTVTVAAAENFSIRYPGPNPGTLNNDSGGTVPSCNQIAGNNDITVTGPRTVTFTPITNLCLLPAGGGGGGGGGSVAFQFSPPAVRLLNPNGFEALKPGEDHLIQWVTQGLVTITNISLHLSTDGGSTFPVIIAPLQSNKGNFLWKVSNLPNKISKVKIEATTTTGLVLIDASDQNFEIVSGVTTAPIAPLVPQETEPITKPIQTIPAIIPTPSTTDNASLPPLFTAEPQPKETKIISAAFIQFLEMKPLDPKAGDTLIHPYRLKNLHKTKKTFNLNRRILDSSGKTIFETSGTQTLDADKSVDLNPSYSIPRTASSGMYEINIRLYLDGKLLEEKKNPFYIVNGNGLGQRLAGRILIDVDKKGEAWYIYPKDNKRYYLGRPSDAFNVMRKLGLGITNTDLAKISVANGNGTSTSNGKIGYILLQVQSKGEAWYYNPVNRKRYFLGRPLDALSIIKNLGMGIKNSDLTKIPLGTIK